MLCYGFLLSMVFRIILGWYLWVMSRTSVSSSKIRLSLCVSACSATVDFSVYSIFCIHQCLSCYRFEVSIYRVSTLKLPLRTSWKVDGILSRKFVHGYSTGTGTNFKVFSGSWETMYLDLIPQKVRSCSFHQRVVHKCLQFIRHNLKCSIAAKLL